MCFCAIEDHQISESFPLSNDSNKPQNVVLVWKNTVHLWSCSHSLAVNKFFAGPIFLNCLLGVKMALFRLSPVDEVMVAMKCPTIVLQYCVKELVREMTISTPLAFLQNIDIPSPHSSITPDGHPMVVPYVPLSEILHYSPPSP